VTCVLAIDTATRYATVAVAVDGASSSTGERQVYSRSWFSQHNHGVELLARVNEALEDAGRSISDLTHIAVVIGPGSFSALRVGLATAQGMALARDLKLIPIPTLEAEIEPWMDHDGPVCAAIKAGSSGVAWGLYHPGENGPVLEASGLDTPADCVEACPGATAFCGEAAQNFSGHVAPTRILSGDAPTRDADALVRIAMRKLEAGESRDPSKVEVTYARAPSISTPKKPFTG
jgi:tRNA threonylcarbamoyladenosine biosynthesis protein TsaB